MEKYYVIYGEDQYEQTSFECQEFAVAHYGSQEQADKLGVPVYMAEDVDAALAAKDARIALYESALKEAEAILGGEYGMHFGPFFDLVQKARSL